MEKFEEILLKYGASRITNQPKTTFEEVENLIDFKLPDDYKDFVLNYSWLGDSVGDQYVVLYGFDELIEINTDNQVLLDLPKTLVIGGNGSGELIAFEQLDDGRLRVVLTPWLVEKESHIEIGHSFTDFLERLDQGKNWFD